MSPVLRIRSLRSFVCAGVACLLGVASVAHGQKVVQLPIRTDGPKSLDPAVGSTTYDNMACVQTYETLLQNKYSNPYEFEPLLLAEHPTTDDGGLTWNFVLKQGVRFHDNKCFPGGKGRQVVTDDVFYSLKRLADKKNQLKNWWLLDNTIDGFNDYKDAQNESESFDYDAPVPGFIKVSDSEFKIRLVQPVYRFLWILTMFQTSIVPHEAVEHYGDDFFQNPVGTGPFILDTWVPKQSISFDRNDNYHLCEYPGRSEWSSDDRRLRLHRAAGQPLPIPDRLEFTMFIQDQPMWLKFQAGEIAYTEVPAEYYEEAFNKRTGDLLPDMQARGIRAFKNALLDLIFRGFNMEDELVGGYTEQSKALRQAISLAMDLDETNEVFYNGINLIYDGPIPPQLDGHPEGGEAPNNYRGPDLAKARELLVKAGYRVVDGKVVDLPPIKYYINQGGNSPQQAELIKRQLAEVGIRLDVILVDFSELIRVTNDKKAPMFSFAWSSDYPDGENNLALFFGPNESPGSNHFNYKRSDYDELYRRILVMPPSEERTRIYEQMRDMIIEDCPYVGSMARTRHYLQNPWVRNFKPTERYWGWFKYLDVDDSARP